MRRGLVRKRRSCPSDLQRLSVSYPAVERANFARLSTQVVEDFQRGLKLCVEPVVIIHHLFIIGTKTDHDPHRQRLQLLQGLLEAIVSRFAVGGNDMTTHACC